VTTLPHLGLYRRVTALALIAGPGLFLVDNVLHPKELPRGHEFEQLARIGDSYQRWQAAHVIGLLSAVVLTAGMLGLAFHVRRTQPGLGLAGGALCVAGAIGLGAGFAIDGFTWGVLGTVSAQPGVDSDTMVRTLMNVQDSSWSFAYYGLIGLWVAGVVTLAIGARRTLPAWGPALLAAGALLVGVEGVVAANWYFIASAVVLLAGGAAVGLAISRMDDAAFAGA
jgi:hypothetical protein